MRLILERKITAGYAVAVAFLLLIGGAAWWSAARSADTFRRVDHSHQVLYQLEATQTRLLVIQADARGYALTANESLLQTYDADEAAVHSALSRVRQLVADNPAQLHRLDQLDPLVAGVIAVLRERIKLRRAAGLEAMLQTRGNPSGRPLMDLVREAIGAMEEAERRLLAERSAAAQSGQYQVMAIVGLGTLLATGLLVTAGLMVRRDFRQRVTAEAVLEHERYLLRTLMDHAPDDIYFKDGAGRFLRNNQGHARRLGLADPAEAVGRTDFDFFSEEHARQAHDDEQEVIRTGRPVTKEEKETWPDGRVTWVLTTKLPLRDKHQRIVGTFGLSRDITERRNAEEKIRELNTRLSTQNRKLRAIFESMPGLCLVLTPDLVIVTATDSYLKATMTEREKIGGRPLFEVFPDNPGDPAADGVRNLRTSLERVRQTAAPDTMAIQKYDVRRPDGTFEERFWSPVNAPVLGADGQLEYIVHRVEDVTDFVRRKNADGETEQGLRIRLERMETEVFRSAQQIQAANRQLEVANHELEAFSYSVSHDLRAPLRHIDGFAGLLRKTATAALDDQGRRYLDTISGAARQMGRLIDDLLSFSRMSRAQVQPVEVDQDLLVAGLVRERGWENSTPAIEWRIAPLPRVRADPAMLRQVWVNLLDNAVKYSGKAPAPCITVGHRTDPATGEPVFFVRDNGAGFDMRYVDKLFGVFQRLHGPTEFEGTGIGLANVRRIVTRHGGRTWAEGRVGEGATFYFSLPVHPPIPS